MEDENELSLTDLIVRVAAGETAAVERLIDLIYPTLHKLAHRQFFKSKRETLCTTDLVHEAYLRLFGGNQLAKVEDRSHLYAAAAKAMRHILVDYARRKHALKRGGPQPRLSLDLDNIGQEAISDNVLALELALQRLAEVDHRCAQVVELKYFGGCSLEEIAGHFNVSTMTIKRDWRKARAFLYTHIEGASDA